MFKTDLHYEELYRKIRLMANRNRFRIVELTQNEAKTITELGDGTNLAFNKCADYVTMLEKEGLVEKTRSGREMLVRAKINLNKLKMD